MQQHRRSARPTINFHSPSVRALLLFIWMVLQAVIIQSAASLLGVHIDGWKSVVFIMVAEVCGMGFLAVIWGTTAES